MIGTTNIDLSVYWFMLSLTGFPLKCVTAKSCRCGHGLGGPGEKLWTHVCTSSRKDIQDSEGQGRNCGHMYVHHLVRTYRTRRARGETVDTCMYITS